MSLTPVGIVRGRRCAAAFGALLAAAAPVAQAQVLPRPDSARRDSAQALPAVEVTVLRTPFDLTRAPFAVSVLGSAEIQRARPGFNLAEAFVAVPGVQVDNRYNYALGERISVRGFGARAQFGVRGVRVLIDGIPATMPDGQTTLNHVDVGELGRAEVVRGPASAMYGNASGGVLQLESEAPADARIAQRARVLGGGDGLLRWQSTTSGRFPAAGTPVGYAVNVSRVTYDGYRAWNDARNTYASFNVGAGGRRTNVQLVGHLGDYAAHNPGALADSALRRDPTQAFRDNVVRWRAGETGQHRQLGATLRQQLGSGELRLSAYGLGRHLDNPIPQRVIALDRQAGGGWLAYGTPLPLGPWASQLVVGAQRDIQRDDRQNFVNDTGRQGPLRLDQLEHVRTAAGFAQLSVDPLPNFSLLGALRYDRTVFEVEDRFITLTDPNDSGERSMKATSPSVGLNWRVSSAVSVYGNYATAFETPTTTELANRPSGAGGFNPDLEPQRTRSVELGARAPLPRLGTFQLAAYRASVRDALIPFEVPGAPGRQFFRNAGSAVHRGIEAGVALLPVSGVTLRASYTYTDARFDEYTVGTVSYEDNRVPGISPHRTDVVLSYEAPLGVLGEVETRYLSATPVSDANRPGTDARAYAVTNLRLALTRARIVDVTFAPFGGVTNLFDRRYAGSVVVNAFGGRYYEPAPARTAYVGLELGVSSRPGAR